MEIKKNEIMYIVRAGVLGFYGTYIIQILIFVLLKFNIINIKYSLFKTYTVLNAVALGCFLVFLLIKMYLKKRNKKFNIITAVGDLVKAISYFTSICMFFIYLVKKEQDINIYKSAILQSGIYSTIILLITLISIALIICMFLAVKHEKED